MTISDLNRAPAELVPISFVVLSCDTAGAHREYYKLTVEGHAQEFFVPQSRVKLENKDDGCGGKISIVTMPTWLAYNKGLIRSMVLSEAR